MLEKGQKGAKCGGGQNRKKGKIRKIIEEGEEVNRHKEPRMDRLQIG